MMNNTNINLLKIPLNKGVTNKAIDTLMAEGGESFYNYVDCLGLAYEPDLVVLSSRHHYYYDPEEMNGFKTVINLKEFNQIKNIKSFLNSFLNYLPQESNFIGCFTDNEKVNGYELKYRSSNDHKRGLDDIDNGIVSSFPFLNMLYSLMDSKIYNYMSRMTILQMLRDYGFKIVDMTEVRGLTLFHSQKTEASYN
jgi:hypothetical protein